MDYYDNEQYTKSTIASPTAATALAQGNVKQIFQLWIQNTGASGTLKVYLRDTGDTPIELGPSEQWWEENLADWNNVYIANDSGVTVSYEAHVKGN